MYAILMIIENKKYNQIEINGTIRAILIRLPQLDFARANIINPPGFSIDFWARTHAINATCDHHARRRRFECIIYQLCHAVAVKLDFAF